MFIKSKPLVIWLAPFYICPLLIIINKIRSHAFHTGPNFCEACCSPWNALQILLGQHFMDCCSVTLMVARSLCIIGHLRMLYEYLTPLVGPSEGIIS